MTGSLYLDMLEEIINSPITHELETQIGAHRNLLLQEHQWLNGQFADRWMGRRRVIEWSSDSPDLMTSDFF